MDATVQKQIRGRHDALLAAIESPQTTDAELASLYGGVAMLLQAAEFYGAAEPAYLNARELAPGELRWPY